MVEVDAIGDDAAGARSDLDARSVDAVRILVMDTVEHAGSGHAGMALGAASLAHVLFTEVMAHDPEDPAWSDRDRFVLSAGHGAPLLYALLHLTGYARPTTDDLRAYRRLGSVTPGHPELHCPAGVEVTTGPLGQGFAVGVGMALAAERLADEFGRPGHPVVGHRVYGIVSDGDLQEGISYEAAALAGHLELGRLIYMYDDNGVTIDGPTGIADSEDVVARFQAARWQVQVLENGDDRRSIRRALHEAAADPRPSLIVARTLIGAGVPAVAGTARAHGGAFGPAAVAEARRGLGWSSDPFVVPDEIRAYNDQRARGGALHAAWGKRFHAYGAEHPDLAAEFRRRTEGRELPDGWDDGLPTTATPTAPRHASQAVLNTLADRLPELFGGSADLAKATLCEIAGGGIFSAGDRARRNIRFGVREHAMAAVANGLALEGGIVPFASTFLAFSDYYRPALRLAAMMKLRVIHVVTHDSIADGGNGPTHQPVEQLVGLRALPGCQVIRPADADEVADAWRCALTFQGPSVIVLGRQPVPWLGAKDADPVERGAYVLPTVAAAHAGADVLLIGTGAEVALCVEAAGRLATLGTSARVVSLPSWERFMLQPLAYRESVLPPAVRARVAVEAGSALGWERWIGEYGSVVCVDDFGASGDGDAVLERFGLTVDGVVRAAERSLEAVRTGTLG